MTTEFLNPTRWYNDYQLPQRYDNQTITVRLHGTPKDTARRFNRTENVRPIPPTDPDVKGSSSAQRL